MPRKNKYGEIVFKDYPEFRPNLTPREIFKAGSFGGTYWRPIYSSVTNKKYKNVHKRYPDSWWKGIPEDHLTRSFDNYDKSKIHFEKSLKIDDTPMCHFEYAKLLIYNLKDYELGKFHFKKAANMEPKNELYVNQWNKVKNM